MFTYKKAPYKIFVLGPKLCWAGPVSTSQINAQKEKYIAKKCLTSLLFVTTIDLLNVSG